MKTVSSSLISKVPEDGTVLREWYNRGVDRKAAFLVNVCDMNTIDNFPVFVVKEEDLENVFQQYNSEQNMVVESIHPLVEIH